MTKIAITLAIAAVLMTTVASAQTLYQPQQYRTPEQRRAELCGILMSRASTLSARAGSLRATQHGDRGQIAALESDAASARAEYIALCH